jgi:endonuclease/exonuclease/phosphatase family metal-dependent hydrolase
MTKIAAFLPFFLLMAFLSSAQPVRIMTYNIRFDNPSDGVNAWPNRKEKVFALIKKYNPDIIGVQEALLHQLTEIEKALPDYSFVGVGRDDGKTKGEYSAVLYKKNLFKAEETKTHWLSETPHVPGSKSWDAAITRILTTVKFTSRRTKSSFYFFNTHFDHIGTEARKNSAAFIKEKASAAGEVPVIITGDLNCRRTEEPYKVLMDRNGIQLIDPAPSNPPGTFCSFVVNSIECYDIDYILYNDYWKGSDYKVITDHDGTHYPSDHLPVMVTLDLIKKNRKKSK